MKLPVVSGNDRVKGSRNSDTNSMTNVEAT